MKLKDLSVTQIFEFVDFSTGNGKLYQKIRDNGDAMECNTCLCIDDLNTYEKKGLMIINQRHYRTFDKDADVIIPVDNYK